MSVEQGGLAMAVHEMIDVFSKQSPVCVMARAALENVLSDARLNEIFDETAQRQYCRQLSFAACAQLMAMVVARIRPSMNAAFEAAKEEMCVSVTSVYNKLQGIEPAVSERLVRDTAASMAVVIDELKASVEGPLPGRDVRILDGNHLAGTEHRIKELRRLGAAALPGQSLCILDPQRKLIEDVIACEDGHANERSLIRQLLERVRPKQCWIADSAYSTMDFMFGVADRKSHFIVRQHGALLGEPQGRRKKIGRVETGVVYEQTLRIEGGDGRQMDVRRVTIHLDKPTKKGEAEVHVLTNLPKSVSARQVAQAYRDRWRIEIAFQEVTTTLRCELNTLGYPAAALFGFCIALVLYNVLSVVQASLRASQTATRKIERNVSLYALTDEIAGVWRGMEIAIPASDWTEAYAAMSSKQLAGQLRILARKADLKRFTTYKWTPKRKQPKRISGNRGNHVSTKQILGKRVKTTP
jgi:IS4 transposase